MAEEQSPGLPVARGKAVFISYASEDAGPAGRLCEVLRAAGLEVWLDQSALRSGDAWDAQIRKQIHECALFLPVISAHTNARTEGYFRREWNLATRRVLDMAHDATFLVPVVVDDTREADARVPEEFLRAHWARLPGGEAPPAFAQRVRQLLGLGSTAVPAEPTAVTAKIEPGVRRLVSRPSWLVAVIASIAAFAAVTGWYGWSAAHRLTASGEELGQPHSIAVLPFVSLSAGAADAYLADGLAETILHRLCDIAGLKVVARTSSFAFKNKSVDIRQIGAMLGADTVLEGSVQRSGDRLRVVAQLIDTRNGTHRWSRSFDRSAADAFAIQDEIAQLIGDTVLGHTTTTAATPSSTSTAKVAEPHSGAFDAYLQGLSELRMDTAQGTERSIAYFRRAVTIDNGYVEAWVGLADAYLAALSLDNPPEQGLQDKAQAALDRAFALRPAYADAYRAFGMLQLSRDLRSSDARRSFEKALELNPNLAAAHEGLAWLAVNTQDVVGARRHFELALQLNPYSRSTLLNSLVLDQADGQFSRARDKIRRLIWVDPTYAEAYRRYADVQRLGFGRLDDSIRYTRHAITLDPGRLQDIVSLAQDELHLGRTAESKALVEKARAIAPQDTSILGLVAKIHLAERDVAAADDAWRRDQALVDASHSGAMQGTGLWPLLNYESWFLLRTRGPRDALAQLQKPGSDQCHPTHVEMGIALSPSVCGYLLRRVGETARGNAILRDALAVWNRSGLRYLDVVCWEEAVIYASLDEQAHAIEALRRAVAQPGCRLSVQHLENDLFDPRFATLRDNAEFQRILARIDGDLDRMARNLDARPQLNAEDLAADVPQGLASSASR